MSSKPFHFKQFTVAQDGSTHKVGTDAVLLGAWVDIRQDDLSVLDIGTGSGVIALMMAQRTSPATMIHAVEINAHDAQQARENFAKSPWAHRISAHHTPIQKFDPGIKFDLITSNPPWFVNSLMPPDVSRTRARHAQQLTYEELLNSVSRLLSRSGRFTLILPYAEGLRFVTLARKFNLLPLRKTIFRTRPHKQEERLLLDLGFEGQAKEETEIILYEEGDTWSPAYQRLTADFYINGRR